jgi:ABC-type transport system involved in multi-copper enzyme maturation permease subunit
MIRDRNHYRLNAIRTISRKSSQTKFWGLGVFIVMSLGFAISSMLLVNTIKFTEVNIVSVEKQPLLMPVMVNAVLVSLYLAFTSAISASREYDKGTLELLLYGPVDESSFILGIFAAQLAIFSVTVMAAMVWTLVCIWQVNLTFQWSLLLIFLATFFMAAQLISLGLLLAMLGGKTRNSLVYLVLAVLFFAAIPLADMIVANLVTVSASTANDPLLIVRDVLTAINGVISWFSPYALLKNALDGVTAGSTSAYLLNMAVMAVETILLLAGSVVTLKKKGVRNG